MSKTKKFWPVIFVCCLLLALAGVSTLSANGPTVKWVDQANGNDSNDGNTETSAYASLQKAIDESESGTAAPSSGTLWPPNHQFVAIDVLGVTDPDGDAVTIIIDTIYQDEPVNAPGSGNTSPDGQGIGSSTAEVRAERVGSGNGRVYHITFTADDGNGGACSGTVLVGVPKSQGKKGGPIDDGPLFDSTGP